MLPRDKTVDDAHEVDNERRSTDNVTLGGEPWTLLQAKLHKNFWGMTHHQERLIEIAKNAKGKTELDTLTHECLHAAFPWMREWAIEQTASEITDILWVWGYRKVE